MTVFESCSTLLLRPSAPFSVSARRRRVRSGPVLARRNDAGCDAGSLSRPLCCIGPVCSALHLTLKIVQTYDDHTIEVIGPWILPLPVVR